MKKYISNSKNFHNLSSLKELSGKERTIHCRNFYHDKKIPHTEAMQKLEHFSDCIKNGILPDGTILEHLANCIDSYINGKYKTMDDALRLRTNAAKHFQAEKRQAEIYNDIAYEIGVKGKKQKYAAKAAYKHHNPNSENVPRGSESLATRYRRERPNREALEKDIKAVHSRSLEKTDD